VYWASPLGLLRGDRVELHTFQESVSLIENYKMFINVPKLRKYFMEIENG